MPKTAFKVFVDVDGTVYGPGYTNPVPDAVVENVGNASIFELDEDSDDAAKEEDSSDEEPADTEPPAPEPSAEDDQREPAADETPEPPRSGAGSGLAVWRAYADSRGVTYPDDADRGAVIDACRNAGVIS